MNRIAIFLLNIVALCSCAFAGSDTNAIYVTGLKEEYSMKDDVSFEIVNRSDSLVSFSCEVEFQDKDAWVAIPFRLEDGRFVKGDTAHSLSPSKTQVLTWSPRLAKPPASFPPDLAALASGMYRIKVTYRGAREQLSTTSAPFRVHAP